MPPLSYPAKGYLSNRGFRWPLSPTFPKHSSELPTWEGHPRTKDGGHAPKLDRGSNLSSLDTTQWNCSMPQFPSGVTVKKKIT